MVVDYGCGYRLWIMDMDIGMGVAVALYGMLYLPYKSNRADDWDTVGIGVEYAV